MMQIAMAEEAWERQVYIGGPDPRNKPCGQAFFLIPFSRIFKDREDGFRRKALT